MQKQARHPNDLVITHVSVLFIQILFLTLINADKTTNLNALAVTEIDKNPSFTLLVGTRHDIITSPYLTSP